MQTERSDSWTVVVGGAGAIGECVTSRLVDAGHRVLWSAVTPPNSRRSVNWSRA